MKDRWLGILVVSAIAAGLLNISSCARDQRLESITLQPSGGFVFEGPGAQAQFIALGTFIHPPETKDVSDKVVWSLDIANFGTITQQGVVTYIRGDGCGSGLVNATYNNPPGNPNGSVIVGSASVKGANDGTAACQ